MFINKGVVLGLFLASTTVIAFENKTSYDCDYDNLDGTEVVIQPMTGFQRFSHRVVGYEARYPFMYDDKYLRSNIAESKLADRTGKLMVNEFYKVSKPNYCEGGVFRRHSLTLQNCKQVWLAYCEKSPLFAPYFDPENEHSRGDVDWLNDFSLFNLKPTLVSKLLKKNLGKAYTILPLKGGVPFYGKSIGMGAPIKIQNYSQVFLQGVDRVGFSMAVDDRNIESSLQLRVKTKKGDKILIGWFPKRFVLTSRLGEQLLKDVKAENLDAVMQGRIEKGFSSEEVNRSWGEPDRVKTRKILVNNETGARYVVPLFKHKTTNIERKFINGNPSVSVVGVQEVWFYNLKRKVLTFSQDETLIYIREFNK